MKHPISRSPLTPEGNSRDAPRSHSAPGRCRRPLEYRGCVTVDQPCLSPASTPAVKPPPDGMLKPTTCMMSSNATFASSTSIFPSLLRSNTLVTCRHTRARARAGMSPKQSTN